MEPEPETEVITSDEPEPVMLDTMTGNPVVADSNDTMIFGSPQQVIVDPLTGMPQNVLIIQQPSNAPKIVGILVIIWGSVLTIISLIGLLGLSLYTRKTFVGLYNINILPLTIKKKCRSRWSPYH